MAGRGWSLFVAGLVLVVGCSADDDDSSTASTANPASTATSTTASTTTIATPSTAPATAATGQPDEPSASQSSSTTDQPARSTTTTANPATSSTLNAPAITAEEDPAAEAGGWRLAIRQPRAGAIIGTVATVCFEVTGTTREAQATLDVSAVRSGSDTAPQPTRVEAALGRSSARVQLDVEPGAYDLQVQLLIDDVPVEGVVVAVPVVVSNELQPTPECP